MIDRNVMLEKLLRMFGPYDSETFLDYDAKDVIVGPDDRALCGFTNHFPKEWLIEDFDFTPEEADWFVSEVYRLKSAEATP